MVTVIAGPDTLFAFDLDDTLYKEIDFVHSGFRAVAEEFPAALHEEVYRALIDARRTAPGRVFDVASARFGSEVTSAQMLSAYRNHVPSIRLAEGAADLIRSLKDQGTQLALVTDGRSLTQRNKINALGLEGAFDAIVISEEIGSSKPSTDNFVAAASQRHFAHSYYLADNPSKDFTGPNSLGWTTLMLLDDGRNIHPQSIEVRASDAAHSSIAALRHIHVQVS